MGRGAPLVWIEEADVRARAAGEIALIRELRHHAAAQAVRALHRRHELPERSLPARAEVEEIGYVATKFGRNGSRRDYHGDAATTSSEPSKSDGEIRCRVALTQRGRQP